jgi:hypothetical protein
VEYFSCLFGVWVAPCLRSGKGEKMTRTIHDLMGALQPYHDILDAISREAHDTYVSRYDPSLRLEHGSRTQANCTYDHIVAAADRALLDDANVIPKDIRGLKVWIFKSQDVVIRFKKMDEFGNSRTYQTRQQKDYDKGIELPGLPVPPVRLTAGYLLDRTGSQYIRSQIARPGEMTVDWCAALIPAELREDNTATWTEVTAQRRFG